LSTVKNKQRYLRGLVFGPDSENIRL